MKLDALSIALVRYAAWGDGCYVRQREPLLSAGGGARTHLFCSRHLNRTRPAKN